MSFSHSVITQVIPGSAIDEDGDDDNDDHREDVDAYDEVLSNGSVILSRNPPPHQVLFVGPLCVPILPQPTPELLSTFHDIFSDHKLDISFHLQ